MTARQAWLFSKARLEKAGFAASQAEAEARQLLGWLVGGGAGLWRNLEAELSDEQLRRLEDALRRRAGGEPLQMIIGSAVFYGLELAVRPGVLVPRPETELLVELALKLLADLASPRVLDVGSGSGAIALAIKHQRPDATVYATDVSGDAVRLTRENARRLGLELTVLQAGLTGGLSDLDLIVANPPYLPAADAASAPPELAWEKPGALYAGADGLAVALPLIEEAARALAPGGRLALELDPRNVTTAAARARQLGFVETAIHPDLSGRLRYLTARRG